MLSGILLLVDLGTLILHMFHVFEKLTLILGERHVRRDLLSWNDIEQEIECFILSDDFRHIVPLQRFSLLFASVESGFVRDLCDEKSAGESE